MMLLRGPRTEIKAAAAALLLRNADERAVKLSTTLRWEELAELLNSSGAGSEGSGEVGGTLSVGTGQSMGGHLLLKMSDPDIRARNVANDDGDDDDDMLHQNTSTSSSAVSRSRSVLLNQ